MPYHLIVFSFEGLNFTKALYVLPITTYATID